MKFLRINGGYYTSDNQWAIVKSFDNEWDIYRAYKPFFGEYVITFKYLKDAKIFVLEKYNK